MNDLTTTIIKILESKLKDSSVRVYLYLYCMVGEFGKSAKVVNKELSGRLNLNIKTVIGALEQLKVEGYINISGKTSNRQIVCIDPYLADIEQN